MPPQDTNVPTADEINHYAHGLMPDFEDILDYDPELGMFLYVFHVFSGYHQN